VVTIILGAFAYQAIPESEFPLYLIRTESAAVFILFSAGYGLLKRQFQWKFNPWLSVACFCLALFCYTEYFPLWLVFTASPVLLGVAVNHLDNLPIHIRGVLSISALRWLGVWSYSIYLWQQFFYVYSWAIPGGKPVALIVAIVAGVASFYLIENPVRKWINTKWSAVPVYRS